MMTGHLRDFTLFVKLRLTLLVVSSGLIGFWLACVHPMKLAPFALFGIGTFLVVAGANAFNEIIERDFDRLMPRTMNRPLPMKRMSLPAAFTLAAAMTVAGLFMLACAGVFWMALTAVLIYLFLYTPMKRKSPLCVPVGAVSGAIPAMMGPAAALHAVTPLSWLMFGIVFFWQFPHFSAIAWLAKDDYKRAGFKVVSEPVDPRFTAYQILLFSAVLMAVSSLLTVIGRTGVYYFIGSFLFGMVLLAYAFIFWFQLSRPLARRVMSAAMLYLPVLFILMILDKTPW